MSRGVGWCRSVSSKRLIWHQSARSSSGGRDLQNHHSPVQIWVAPPENPAASRGFSFPAPTSAPVDLVSTTGGFSSPSSMRHLQPRGHEVPQPRVPLGGERYHRRPSPRMRGANRVVQAPKRSADALRARRSREGQSRAPRRAKSIVRNTAFKRFLRVRPVFHHRDDTAIGHIVGCFLALRLEVDLQNKLDQRGIDNSWPDVMRDLTEVRGVTVTLDDQQYRLQHRTPRLRVRRIRSGGSARRGCARRWHCRKSVGSRRRSPFKAPINALTTDRNDRFYTGKAPRSRSAARAAVRCGA